MKKLLFLLFIIPILSFGQTRVKITQQETVELFPHTIDTGLGTEASPYINADSTAGIKTKIAILKAGRGGTIKLSANRFNIDSVINITSSGIRIQSVVAGYNADSNAVKQGLKGTTLICKKGGIIISGTGYPTGRTGGVMLNNLYFFGTKPFQSIGSTTGTVGVQLNSYIDQPSLWNVNIGGFDYGLRSVNSSGGWVDYSYFDQFQVQGGRVGAYYDNAGGGAGNLGQHFIKCLFAETKEHNFYVSGSTNNINFVFTSTSFYRGSSAVGVTNPANVYFAGTKSRFNACEFVSAGIDLNAGTTVSADGLILAGSFNNIDGSQFINNSHYGLNISGHDNVVSNSVFTTNGTDIVISGYNNTVTGSNLNSLVISGNGNTISSCTFNYSPVNITITGNNNILYVSNGATVSDTGTGNSIIGDFMLLKPGLLQAITKGVQVRPTLTSGASFNLIGVDITTSNIGGVGTISITGGGSSYTPGTYTSVPLTATSGTGALATVVVNGGGSITSVTKTTAGSGYILGASVSISAANVGGTGSGFSSLLQTLSATNLTLAGLRLDGIPYGSGGGLGVAVNNIAIGIGALQSNTIGGSGSPDIAIGNNVLTLNTTGTGNNGIGQDVLKSNTTGINNTALGTNALTLVDVGTQNTAVGYGAAKALTVGNYTTAVGQNALLRTTTPDYNTGLGSNSGQNNITGAGNIFVGAYSGQEVTSSNNTIVGFNGSGGTGGTGKNSIFGASTYFSGAAFDHNIILADGDGNSRLMIDAVGRVQFLATSNQGTYPTFISTSTFTVPQVINKGSLPWPKITTAQRTAISSPLEGITAYDTDLHNPLYFDGTSWRQYNGNNHIIFTPTTGSTVTLVNNQENIINPTGALLAITLALPASPANNDTIPITFTQSVSTITYTGGTVVGGLTTIAQGGQYHLTYDLGTTTWY